MTDMDMADIEQRLRDAMSASVAEARPSFGADDVRQRHRRHFRRVAAMSVVSVVSVAVVVIAVAVLPAPVGLPSRSGTYLGPTSVPGLFVERHFGWTVRYPRGMHVGTLPRVPTVQQGRGGGRGGDGDGVRITNFAPNLSVPGKAWVFPPMGWLRTFPADGVAVQIWHIEQSIIGGLVLRDSALPLARGSFSLVSPYIGGSEPRPWYRVFHGDGFTFVATVWLGPRARQASKRAMWAVLRSLRFPPLTEGTIWQQRYFVLGPAARYAPGSVTDYPASSLPKGRQVSGQGGFYLVRGLRSFYVISQVFWEQTLPHGTCTVVFDAKDRQFSCPGTLLRWNILGQLIGPSGPTPFTPLDRRVVLVAQDGHLLYRP